MHAILIFMILSAPAPLPKEPIKPKPITRDCLVGEWGGFWGGVECPSTLTIFGSYRCTYNDKEWYGHWFMDGRGRLVIEASRADVPNRRWKWVIEVKRHGKEVLGEASREDETSKGTVQMLMKRK